MNNTFSNNLYQFIRKHIPGINPDVFYDSLIKSTKSGMTGKQQTISLKAFFSEAAPDNSYYKEFRRSILNDKKSIAALYEEYIHKTSEGKEAESMLIDLFYRCLAESSTYFSCSLSRQQLKPAVFKNTKGREEDASQLMALLDKHHKIIISGNHGTGKSHFIRYFLTRYKLNDYFYISYDSTSDLKTNLHQIQYQGSFDSTYYGSEYELMKEEFSPFLLIIDHMYLPHCPFEELELLAKFNVNILIVTLSPVKTDSFFPYELPQLSHASLLQIFTGDSGFLISDNSIREDLFTVTGQNALMISLIARLCKRALETSHVESPLSILESILTQLQYPDNHINNEKIPVFRFKHAYTGYAKTLDIIGHIKPVIRKSLDYMDPAAKDCMKWLCCFGSCGLPLDFVLRLIPNCSMGHLEMLHNLGLIDLTDDMLQLSPLIAHAVFADRHPDPAKKEFTAVIHALTYFLQTYDNDLSVPYLSKALLTFVKTLYKRVPTRHNPAQKTVSEQYENWQELIYLIYSYYHQNGDYFMADEVSSSLHYPDLISKHSSLDAGFFHLGNAMQMESCVKRVPVETDNLCKDISDNPEQAVVINSNYYMINALDTCIGLYCYNLLPDRTKTVELFNYQQSLIHALKKILHLVEQKKTGNQFPLSEEKLCYYFMCHQIMTSFSAGPVDCFRLLSDIKKTGNRNYHIRGTAFILFMQSCYLYWLYSNWQYLRSDCASPALLYSSLLAPEMNYLHEQIRSSKLIPVHTCRICLLSYINAGMIQYCFKKENPETPVIVTIDNIRELLRRSILNKEETESALRNAEKYFS